MPYPDKCIRGISSPDWLEEGRTLPNIQLFGFSSDPNGWIRESINWMDEQCVIDFTLNQVKVDGTPKFRSGVAILVRADIDRISKRHTLTQPLSYERASTEENPHHGNLLLKHDIKKNMKGMIRSALAYACKIIPREDK